MWSPGKPDLKVLYILLIPYETCVKSMGVMLLHISSSIKQLIRESARSKWWCPKGLHEWRIRCSYLQWTFQTSSVAVGFAPLRQLLGISWRLVSQICAAVSWIRSYHHIRCQRPIATYVQYWKILKMPVTERGFFLDWFQFVKIARILAAGLGYHSTTQPWRIPRHTQTSPASKKSGWLRHGFRG